ncbi:PfkB family carbohydrate kinase [Streptacidiphilus rugosus]|uniref:PfkB family carbohydrate kinase n=1 Tax=Streptacidiphilus rugosus TaxID=405783 RepID=UPI00068C0B71|nr:PfkB family carbohydrate kinase [Streptacidiphilus rugosus]
MAVDGRSVAVIGEALVDLVWPNGATTLSAHAGGSPANVALGLRRLDRPVTLLTSWGEDAPGGLVAEHLAAAGLRVRRAPDASGRTMIALAHLDPGTGAADYDFLTAWDPVAFPLEPEVTLLHTGSLAVVIEPGATLVAETCAAFRGEPGRAVSVDLNVRPAVQPDRDAYRAAAARVVEAADVVKASDEDLTWLWPDRTPEEAARGLLTLGPRLVVLTRGGAGALALTAGHRAEIPAPRVAVVDTIGAGDAFQSSLLDGLFDAAGIRLPESADELTALLRRCVVAGALACTRPGAQPPTRAELAAALAQS